MIVIMPGPRSEKKGKSFHRSGFKKKRARTLTMYPWRKAVKGNLRLLADRTKSARAAMSQDREGKCRSQVALEGGL